jgi:hypothetical protein
MDYTRSIKNGIYSRLLKIKKLGQTNKTTDEQKFIYNLVELSTCLRDNLNNLHQLFGLRVVKNGSFMGFFKNTSNSLLIRGKFNYKKSEILKGILTNYQNILHSIQELLNMKILKYNEEINLFAKENVNNTFTINNNLEKYKKNAFPAYKKILLNIQNCLSTYKLKIPQTSSKELATQYYVPIDKINDLNNLITNELEILKTYNDSFFSKMSKMSFTSSL